MYEPYRDGKEWWLCVEMVRILLLSSCVGFLARSCYMKILAAQVIGLAFLILFVSHHPYRKSQHHTQQTIALLVPVVTMAWAFAGGWEKLHHETTEQASPDGAGADDGAGYDVLAIVALHVALLPVEVSRNT